MVASLVGLFIIVVIVVAMTRLVDNTMRKRRATPALWDDGHPKDSKPQYTSPDPPNPPNPFTRQVWSPDGERTYLADQHLDIRTDDDG